ncbi:LysR family transcriptional regulator [Sphingobium jiangsuense]|uniref:DNA-binding transcriptional LysR family regulator n=1 Tax=Sphingobium jiangsuense TaxID=870476 RepID=A0A7W6BNV1_9SPHN|nr:LysR family transcriptional regulator [Sphingobium jiangsuense]MBB3927037.1 DNA-binding transcriptional LysR family regulator [Sphingobium jiangsuense]GLT00296.1 LysR family transcriptional regulator [Sphingobium jiangsuense]
MFHWDDLRIFLTVARTKRIALAARSLDIDATTIARRLNRLAEALDAQLFEQAGAERILTERGMALLRHAESVEEAALAAAVEVKGERYSLKGHVRLSVAEGFGTWILAPGLPAFQEQHPGIRLDIITASGFLNPSKREADMAVMLARPQRGHLSVQRLADYRLHLYASADYLAGHGRPRGPAALHDHALVGYVPEFLFSPELDYLDEVEAGLEAGLRSTSIAIQRQLILGGAGIGILPDFIVPPESGLVRVLEQEVEITRSFWLVTHHSLVKLARIKAVSDLLRRRVEAVLTPGGAKRGAR